MPNFPATCVNVECLEAWSTHEYKTEIYWLTHEICLTQAQILCLSSAMKLGPGGCSAKASLNYAAKQHWIWSGAFNLSIHLWSNKAIYQISCKSNSQMVELQRPLVCNLLLTPTSTNTFWFPRCVILLNVGFLGASRCFVLRWARNHHDQIRRRLHLPQGHVRKPHWILICLDLSPSLKDLLAGHYRSVVRHVRRHVLLWVWVPSLSFVS